jgi:CelD/BcsL family acetyltransferase involved in cellulose biosynthesis
MVIEKCITEGLVELDLSRGEESYKYRWGGREKRNLHIVLFMNFGRMICAHVWKYTYLSVARNSLTQIMRRLLGTIAGINTMPFEAFDLIEGLTRI